MLKRANIQWTGKALKNQIEKGNVVFDCSVQRGLVWDLQRKSLLINSMIEGYPIPALYFSKRDDGKYDALDGKQRSNAITTFINGEYSLCENVPIICDDDGNESDISEMYFKELPEWAQNEVLDYSLTIYYYEGITEDEISELFYRINNGKPLTAIELTRVKAKSIDKFQEIAKHEMIANSISEKGKEKYNDENLAMQVWAVCFSENVSFATKDFRPLIEKAEVSADQIISLNKALDYIKYTYDTLDIDNEIEGIAKAQKRIAKKIKTKTHLVSLVYAAFKSIDADVTNQVFSQKIQAFFNSTKTSINDEYNTSCGNGIAKPEAIAKRIRAMDMMVNSAKFVQEGNTEKIV